MSKIFLILFTLLLSQSLFAETKEILTVTSDVNAKVLTMEVKMKSDGSFEELIITTTLNNNVIKIRRFSLGDLQAPKAIFQEGETDTVLMNVAGSFSEQYGGLVEAQYLSNGISKKYLPYSIELLNREEGWEVHKNGKKINSLFIKGRRWLGKVIGIASLVEN